MYEKQVRLSKLLFKLMTMKMRLKLKNRSYKYDINRPRLRHGHKCTEQKMCLSVMVVIFIKQT